MRAHRRGDRQVFVHRRVRTHEPGRGAVGVWDTDGYECALAFARSSARVDERALTGLNEGFLLYRARGLATRARSEWILSVVRRSSAIDRVVDAFVF